MAATYNFREVFLSEMFGMWFVITMALAGVANHVLNPTTGRGMGYLAIAVQFGFAFAFPIVAFGSISAMFNPAAALSQVVAGNLGAAQFFTVVLAEMVGSILGGLTVWILYMPQLYKAGAQVFTFADLKEGYTSNSRLVGVRGKPRNKQTIMAPKADVESTVNPVHTLEEQDDPFLGIWVSRPASFNPLISLIAEALMTFIFLFLVNMMTARGQYLYQPSYGMYSNIVLPILIGFVICSMILATGPTGFAGNPARDLGPRIAHWILPIPKHSMIGSEWWYAWVPVLGPLIGGALAGAVYKGYIKMLKGQVTSDANPWATNALGASSVTAALNVSQPVTNNASLAAPGSAAAGAANFTVTDAAAARVPKLF